MGLPIDSARKGRPPASPLVEATLSLVQERLRDRFAQSGQDWDGFRVSGAALTKADLADVERRLLATGHRFDWSAGISVAERPDIYKSRGDGDQVDESFSHPDAPQGEPDETGRALAGVGDNVVRHDADITGIARFIRTNERVLDYLTNGVPPGIIAVIDDSGGTLTAPIIEQFTGVICAGGTVRSHLGILTREYNIPCLMNAKIAGIADGDTVTIEATAAAKTTEDYQQGVDRVGRVWRLVQEEATA
ncbi:PEP-utilizing enzyme [Sphingobium sp. WCS2017Hpa-17]|uniref:PEP-utilizing enzyme n=1 Tax=Sphingobium sp. WCS2017Hpa-17 TaxID=3073638 RepID=UPI00288AF2C6|nr:PEP-utilizing enzyme [Sphingobium sp. WCS2017Hpa-17]